MTQLAYRELCLSEEQRVLSWFIVCFNNKTVTVSQHSFSCGEFCMCRSLICWDQVQYYIAFYMALTQVFGALILHLVLENCVCVCVCVWVIHQINQGVLFIWKNWKNVHQNYCSSYWQWETTLLNSGVWYSLDKCLDMGGFGGILHFWSINGKCHVFILVPMHHRAKTSAQTGPLLKHSTTIHGEIY